MSTLSCFCKHHFLLKFLSFLETLCLSLLQLASILLMMVYNRPKYFQVGNLVNESGGVTQSTKFEVRISTIINSLASNYVFQRWGSNSKNHLPLIPNHSTRLRVQMPAWPAVANKTLHKYNTCVKRSASRLVTVELYPTDAGSQLLHHDQSRN